MSIRVQIIVTSLILLVTIVLFGRSDIDIYIQNMFYDYSNHSWILNRDAQPYKILFYSGIKKLLISVAVLILLSLLFFRKNETIKRYKKGLLIVLLSAIFVPASIGALKSITNMPCPKDEITYGGKMPRSAVWQRYKEPYRSMKKIKCWPAGHASGGFALMSLFFLFRRKRNRVLGLLFGVTVGWIMGLYKMAIGDHFLSHTIITMEIAWLVILLTALIVKRFFRS